MSNEYLNNKSFEAIIEAFLNSKKQKLRCELILKDMGETQERRTRLKITNKTDILDTQKVRHKVACDCFKVHQEQLAHAFYLLSENIANCARFSGIDIDDAIQEGVLICFEKIDRFDPRRGKAFNYMTTCIINHYRQIYRSVRNYNELKKRYHRHLQDKFESVFFRNGKERTSARESSQSPDYDTA